MTKPLAITERQVTALCRGAAKAGYAPIVQIGNAFVRLVPENHAIPPQPDRRIDESVDPDDFQSFDEYLAWRDGGGAGAN